jgi:hypothetical protein
MARPRLELGTPRFSGTPERRHLRRKSLQIGGSVRDRRDAHPRGYRRLQAGLVSVPVVGPRGRMKIGDDVGVARDADPCLGAV